MESSSTSFSASQSGSNESSKLPSPKLGNASISHEATLGKTTLPSHRSHQAASAINTTLIKSVHHAIPPLDRDYPVPAEDLDITEALQRQPGRWTFKGQMDANAARAKLRTLDETAQQERRRADMEAAKARLLGFAKSRK